MSTAHALAELERSPELFEHIAYLQRVVEDEQHRRERFERETGRDAKAEFINGRIEVQPPAEPAHSQTILYIARLLGEYAGPRGLGTVWTENCLVGCRRNDYAPDVCFFSAARCAGWGELPTIFPPPDLAVEVLSPASAKNDRTLKLQDYARHGIGEYWIVDADQGLLEQYVLSADGWDYRLNARLPATARLASVVLTGFTIPTAALFDGEENARALRTLHLL